MIIFQKFCKIWIPHGQFSRNRHPTWKKKFQNFFQNFLKMVLRYTKNVKKNFFSIFVVFLQIWSQHLNLSWKRHNIFSKIRKSPFFVLISGVHAKKWPKIYFKVPSNFPNWKINNVSIIVGFYTYYRTIIQVLSLLHF